MTKVKQNRIIKVTQRGVFMQEMTVSFSKGKPSETSIKHNNRSIEKDFDFSKMGHDHIKSEFTHLNEVLKHQNIREAYDEIFGQAVDEYNTKQKRQDRKIKNYYDKIAKSDGKKGAKRTQYEFIVQVGNIDNWKKYSRESKQWQAGKAILKKYYDDFQKRNPNLAVYNAAIHMDEQGAPHLHLNVIPVASGYKRGVAVRPSFNKALKQEGIEGSEKDSRAIFRNFQAREQEAISEIAKNYGIQRISGLTNKLRDVHEYKEAMAQINKVERERDVQKLLLSNVQQQTADAQNELELVVEATNKSKDKNNDLEQRYKHNQKIVEKQEEQIQKNQALLERANRLHQLHRDGREVASKPVSFFVPTNVLGVPKKEETEQRVANLQRLAGRGVEAEKLERQLAKVKQEEKTKIANAVDEAVAKATKPLKQELAEKDKQLKEKDRKIDEMRTYIADMTKSVREFFKSTPEKIKSFWRGVGARMREHSINKFYGQPSEAEKQQIQQGNNNPSLYKFDSNNRPKVVNKAALSKRQLYEQYLKSQGLDRE